MILADILIFGGSGYLFLRGIYHAGGLARLAHDGIRTKPLDVKLREERNCVDCQDAGKCVNNRRCQVPRFDHDAHELALFRDTGAWWLDPNRWGVEARKHEVLDKVLSDLDAIPVVYGRLKPPPPRCACGTQMHVATQHGDHVSLWGCPNCGREWVPVGVGGLTESRLSRRRREKKERIAASKAAALARELEERRLPCGCTGEVWTRAYPTGGWDMGRYAECVTCKGTWDYAPKYKDTGNPRKKVRGEVEWPNGNAMLPEQLQNPPGGLK